MSELNPLNGGKKSRVFEERRRREEQERERQRRAERERRRKKQKRRQMVLLSFIAVFLIVCTTLIAVNVKELLQTKDRKTENVVREEETTPQEVISVDMDLKDIAIDESMYLYDNDPEMLQQLRQRMYSNAEQKDKLEFILDHQAAYPPEMIEFLVKYEEVIDFVLKYPVEINKEHATVVDVSGEYTKGKVPTFVQWDDRWGYLPYGDNVIADSGCGPTCLSMAMVALTGKTQYTPIVLCDFAEKNGYYVDGVGSSWDLMLGGAKKLGLESSQISIKEESIKNTLEDGKLVILSMGPGIFTKGGHFILIYKYENGKFYVKDPNSWEKSDQGFTYSQFGDQIKGGWGLYVKDKTK